MKTHGAIRFGAIALLLFASIAGAMAVTFTQDTLIGFSDLSYDGADIVITNCTLTVDGPHIFHSLVVQNAGVLTHSPNTNGPQQTTVFVLNEPHVMSSTNPTTLGNLNVDTSTITVLNTARTTIYTEGVDYVVSLLGQSVQLTLTTNSTIAEGATVLVNYDWEQTLQGFTLYVNNGVTVQAGGAINVSGKGYAGGLGANSGINSGAGANQITNFPFSFTAGGGGGHGGAGGVSSTSARGGATYDSTTSPASLGSGGGNGSNKGGAGGGSATILVSGNFQIDGLVLADGAKGTNAHSGGGAGGSLLLSADTFSGAGTIAANGGGGDTPDGGGGGGGRVALFFATNNFAGPLTAFGGGGSTYGGAGTIYLEADSDTAGRLLIANAGKRGTNTTFAAAISDLTISGGAIAQPELQPVNLPTLRMTNLFIGTNSCLLSWKPGPFLVTVSGDARIESNAAINADFIAGAGPGSGSTSCGAGPGASYGGIGGTSVCGSHGGLVYGSISQPSTPGSGAGVALGGGAITMTVAGTLSLDGAISANGGSATVATSGSGSGGGIWLTVGTFSGAGMVSANGGSASNLVSGGGGGGRIAIYFNTNSFFGSIAARGGTGTNSGGPGSIYLKGSSDPIPQIIFDNGGIVGSTYLSSPLDISDLVISGGAMVTNFSAPALRSLLIGADSRFAGNLTVTATNATIQSGGALAADGISTSLFPIGGQPGSIDISGNGGGGGGGAGYGGAGATNIANINGGGYANSQYSNPTVPGGMGGSGAGAGGLGGGAININIPGTLILNGRISANGLPGVGSTSGGGGGGSVILSARTIRGTGSISANGGAGTSRGGGGGGGGIAFFTDTNLFSGTITAYGGISGANNGGAGTIYQNGYNRQGIAGPVLLVDNGGNLGAKTPLLLFSDSPDVTVTGGAVVSNTVTTIGKFKNLLIGANSAMVSPPMPTYAVNGNLTILAGGSLNVDGLSASQSIGIGQTLNFTGGGGGAGGVGGPSALGAAGGLAMTDSISSPVIQGGRGGPGSPQGVTGGNGGGAMRLTVGGILRVDGRLSAEGAASPSSDGGGGGGGSLWIATKGLSGSGVISANGGSGIVAGGGGGGGHIAISYNSTNLFTGGITARGGSGANYGGAGFVYLAGGSPTGPVTFQLIVDNGGVPGGLTPLNTSIQGITLNVTGGAILTNNNAISFIQNLLIGSNSTWVANAYTGGAITVQSNVNVQAGGLLSMDGIVTSGPARGQWISNRGGGGAGHGGYGGSSISNTPGGNITQDSITQPNGQGSAGGTDSGIAGSGGGGGGVLQLTVRGTLQLDGRISANGTTAISNLNSGGGSGGSIWLQVGKFAGAGILSANGGAANNLGGGGGGGRVAVWYNTNQFTGAITARGGAGANAGGAGTVYLNPSMLGTAATGRLILDNGNARGTNMAIFSTFSTADVLITNGTSVTLATSPAQLWRWNSLTITSNSVVNTASNYTINLTIISNLDIQAGGALTTDGEGYPANSGTGRGFPASLGSGGAGHGGLGSLSIATNTLLGGQAYDSINSPTTFGSGGGSLTRTSGSAGGGAIELTVNGTLKVNGVLSANGGDATTSGAGGGSGGSILVSAGTISGNGRIYADGGDGDLFTSGGGGGGRISLTANSNTFTGALSARGGAGAVLAGGAGTIYLQTNYFSNAPLVLIDNGGQLGTRTPLSPLSSMKGPTALALRNGAVGNGISSLLLQNLLIDSDATLIATTNSATITLTVVGDALVDTNGAIVSDAAGYNPGYGPGSGAIDSASGDGGGGGYGGAGGAGFTGGHGGATYGSSNQPIDLGSGGGVYPPLTGYSQGGGALRLTVGGALTLNGIVSANGADGIIDGAGGGSGGSIWISAPKFSGNGWVTVNGGMGEGFEGGGGGGGRIAIYSPTNSFAGNLLAFGGDGANPGHDGTIYMPTSLLISGSVTDSNGLAVAGLTLQPSGMPSVTSDINGSYSINLPPLWAGTVTPIGSGVIVPSVRVYTSLMSNPTGQDYVITTPAAFNLSSSQSSDTNVVTFSWYGLSGARYQMESSSNLMDWTPYGSPYIGGNAPISVVVPPTGAPQLYFRLNVLY